MADEIVIDLEDLPPARPGGSPGGSGPAVSQALNDGDALRLGNTTFRVHVR